MTEKTAHPNLTDYLVLHPADDVGVALKTLDPFSELQGGQQPRISAKMRIPRGHKIALRDLAAGEPVLKFGCMIGTCMEPIAQGEHVHSHNLAFRETEDKGDVGVRFQLPKPLPHNARDTFMGYKRANGAVGTRNYIAVLTSVNCSATAATLIARNFPQEELVGYENVDGIAPFVHGTGCGLDKDGIGFANLQRVLWGYARNPNVGGVLLVGLGCEVVQISFLLEAYGIEPGPLFRTLNIQSSGGTQKSIQMGIDALREMLPHVNQAKRTEAPVSELKLALQCGGSDAWSGISANPALGVAADKLIAQGGSALLAETPEIYGAEHLLIERAANQKVADKLNERIGWWKHYTSINGGSLDNNPSPGNKLGGLTTILEKSLGAVAKSGSSGLVDVLQYGDFMTKQGFQFMDSPGFDPVSVTGQIASGCNIVCFTTGRGSAFGSKPSPTIKLSSTSELSRKMPGDIDIDCGKILTGEESLNDIGDKIYQKIIKVASGEMSLSEKQGLGDLEFVPWQVGATM